MSAGFIWLVASIFYLYEVVLRVSPSVMTSDLMSHFGVHAASLGFLTSAYYYSYVTLQTPGGLIVDRFGPRCVITLSAFISVVGILVFSYSNTLLMAQLGRFLIGTGAACAFISCLKIINLWFDEDKFSRICGLTNMMGTLGGLSAGYPLGYSVDCFGWRNTTFYLGVIGLIITILAFSIIRNKKVVEKDVDTHFFAGLLKVVQNKHIWLIGISSGLMYIPLTAFTDLWGVPFIKATYGISTKTASSINSLLYLGGAVGGVAFAFVANYFNSYIKTMKISALLTAILFILIAFGRFYPMPILAALLFLAGAAMGGQVLSFACVNNLCSARHCGVGMGFNNALTMLSGLIFQPLLGYILDIAWRLYDNGLVEHGVRVYSEQSYSIAILVITGCLLMSYVLLACVPDMYHKKTSL